MLSGLIKNETKNKISIMVKEVHHLRDSHEKLDVM
jgi:hypothetical protein